MAYRAHKKDHCESCGFVPLHSCQLDVDHRDGDKTNNDPNNYITICANCHRIKTCEAGESTNVKHRRTV